MRYVFWVIDNSNSLLGADLTAGLISVLVMFAFLSLYGFVFVMRERADARLLARLAVPEPPKRITCPDCTADFTDRLEERRGVNMIYKTYRNYQITCEGCLAVSHWETSGYPVCIDWRPATNEEIQLDYKNKVFLQRLQEIEDFKKNLASYEEFKRLNGKGSSLLSGRRSKPF